MTPCCNDVGATQIANHALSGALSYKVARDPKSSNQSPSPDNQGTVLSPALKMTSTTTTTLLLLALVVPAIMAQSYVNPNPGGHFQNPGGHFPNQGGHYDGVNPHHTGGNWPHGGVPSGGYPKTHPGSSGRRY